MDQVYGIDVSNHQGDAVDWQAVADSGHRFAYVKASEGSTFRDWTYAGNVDRARDAGVQIGAYHFARLGAGELDHFLSMRPSPVDLDLPPVLDLEVSGPGMNVWARDFLEELELAAGRPPVLYTGFSFPAGIDHDVLIGFPLWLASYTAGNFVDPDPATIPAPRTPRPWGLWQFTSSARVPGVPTLCDRNVAAPGWWAGIIDDHHQEEDDVTPEQVEALLAPIVEDVRAIKRELETYSDGRDSVRAKIDQLVGALFDEIPGSGANVERSIVDVLEALVRHTPGLRGNPSIDEVVRDAVREALDAHG